MLGLNSEMFISQSECIEQKKIICVRIGQKKYKKVKNDILTGMYFSRDMKIKKGDVLAFYTDGIAGATPKWVKCVQNPQIPLSIFLNKVFVQWGN